MDAFVPDPEELVSIDFDNLGVPTEIHFKCQPQHIAHKQLESALSGAVVTGFSKRFPVMSDRREAEHWVSAIAENGFPKSEITQGPDGQVEVETVLGRPVRLTFRTEFISRREQNDIARSVIDACAVALTEAPHDRKSRRDA